MHHQPPPQAVPLSSLLHTDTLATDNARQRYTNVLEDTFFRSTPQQAPIDPKSRAATMATLDRLRSMYSQEPSTQQHNAQAGSRRHLRRHRLV